MASPLSIKPVVTDVITTYGAEKLAGLLER